MNDKLQNYLDTIGKDTLLTDAEEYALALRIQSGDEMAINILTEKNLRYVVSVAHQYQNRGIDTDDLIAEGNIGLLEAARKFDADHGKRFVAYAAPFVRKRMETAIAEQGGTYIVPKKAMTRQEKNLQRKVSMDAPVPAGSKNNFTLHNILADADALMPDSALRQESMGEDVGYAMQVLDARERKVIRLFFGLQGERLTMAQIADDMGIKRERVRQIRDKALRKLKRKTKFMDKAID
jgi:RNA polymerase primary sigma factor